MKSGASLSFLLLLVAAVEAEDCVTDDGREGTCVDYRYYVCHAGVVQGLCSGDSNIRCCLDCDAECVADENEWDSNGDDEECKSYGGQCFPTSNYCAYSYNDDWDCGGPTDRQCCGLYAPDPEFRSTFVASAFNVDFPTNPSDSTDEEKAQLDAFVDSVDGINFNAIMFQVRPASDALYESDIEPWSDVLTGSQGTPPNPYYDPLEYVIDAAHAKGVELHAWLNPYRAKTDQAISQLSSDHICNTLPQYCYYYDRYLWMDPGAQEVQDRLIEVIADLLTRYDLDGIHFDDYFYPYSDGSAFPDSNTCNDYQVAGGTLGRDDWRRDNVNKMVERVSDTVHSTKPGARFSISPFGLYKPGEPGGMPDPIVGLDPYSELYADSLLWLQEGWVDFLAPQLYWRIDPPQQSYPVLLDWWVEQNTGGRHIYAATALYQIDDSEQNWPTSELTDQVGISRDEDLRSGGSLGNIHYSAKYLRSNYDGIADAMLAICPAKVSVPSYPWLSSSLVEDLEVIPRLVTRDGKKAIEVSSLAEGVTKWTVHKVEEGGIRLLATKPRSTVYFSVPSSSSGDIGGTYLVTGLDRANVAGNSVTIHV